MGRPHRHERSQVGTCSIACVCVRVNASCLFTSRGRPPRPSVTIAATAVSRLPSRVALHIGVLRVHMRVHICRFNEIDEVKGLKVDRRSHHGSYAVIDHVPLCVSRARALFVVAVAVVAVVVVAAVAVVVRALLGAGRKGFSFLWYLHGDGRNGY